MSVYEIYTVTILIGNSDNKLTQSEWCNFCNHVHKIVETWKEDIKFSAPSVGWADWQNCCWVVTIAEPNVAYLTSDLSLLLDKYKQDSIAVCVGNTSFVTQNYYKLVEAK